MMIYTPTPLRALILISGLLLGSAEACFGQQPDSLKALYEKAESLFNRAAPTAATDSLALRHYLAFARQWQAQSAAPQLRMDAWQKAAILRQTYGAQEEALHYYQQAIATGQKYRLDEQLFFQPYLYAANALYFLQRMDSSIFYLKQAEKVLNKYPEQAEAGRLYNAFGAIYFELGNYQQSVNYFSKAMDEVREVAGESSEAVMAFQSNIASALRHLQAYDSAIHIYQSLLPRAADPNEVYINLGTTYLEQQRADSALYYLSQVDETGTVGRVVLYNKLAQAFYLKGDGPRAIASLEKSLQLQHNEEGQMTNDRLGFTFRLYGDVLRKNGDYEEALSYYHQAILAYDANFENADIYSNPQSFAGDFTSFSLFDALTSKAACFSLLYEQSRENRYLLAAIDTYASAIRMADYVSKVFDNENARIFLSEKAFPAYQHSIRLLVQAYQLTKESKYLENAMRWSEKSKANSLAVSLKENQVKAFSGLPDSLLLEERKLKQALSRLFVRIDNSTNEQESQQLKAAIRDNELALSRLQDLYHDFPEYYRQKFSYDSLDIAFLQSQVLDDNMALLSYFHSGDSLHLFILTHQQISHRLLPLETHYSAMLDTLETELRTFEPGRPYRGKLAARYLYDLLITPATPEIQGIESLIVIPHQRLNNVPFEVLENAEGEYLLRRYDVIYQFAASFLQPRHAQRLDMDSALVVAPFTEQMPAPVSGLVHLPSSGIEVQDLRGTRLQGKAASKSRFLELTPAASMIHLATHAVAESEEPSRSYVAFYPHAASDSSYKLFAHELYNVNLSQTRLAFLSACETSEGKLINSEGIMSLSRAFAYAGCANLVTSLWEAEDHATAYISRRFYHHLQKGDSFARSLRRAKLDFLQDPAFAQFHAPQYWSHMVFIGMPGEERPVLLSAVWWLAALLSLSVVFIMFRKLK
jgi:CHAT domain-containing protein